MQRRYFSAVTLAILWVLVLSKKNPDSVIKEHIKRAGNDYNAFEVPRNEDGSPLDVEMELDIKGVLEVDIVQGTLKILGAFRARFIDKKLSWENLNITGIAGRKSITCKEAAERRKYDPDLLKYYPDSVNCVDFIVTKAQTTI